MLHYLEKMRARGCVVKYIKPLWLIEEEKILKTQLAEFEAEASIARGAYPDAEYFGKDNGTHARSRLSNLFRLPFFCPLFNTDSSLSSACVEHLVLSYVSR